jgi:hypothetical protein
VFWHFLHRQPSVNHRHAVLWQSLQEEAFFLFLGPLEVRSTLPANDGVFTVKTDYVLVDASGVTFNGGELGGQATTMIVSSIPEPTTAIYLFIGLTVLLGLARSLSVRSGPDANR